MIKPTVGRIVWYYDSQQAVVGQEQAAIVSGVHSDNSISITVFPPDGTPYGLMHVFLAQEGDRDVPFGPHARWMPFQVEAQKRYEEAKQAMVAVKQGYTVIPEPQREGQG